MATVHGSGFFVFQREQLLVALADHYSGKDSQERVRITTEIQEFLYGPAALKHGLRVEPSTIEVGTKARGAGDTAQSTQDGSYTP